MLGILRKVSISEPNNSPANVFAIPLIERLFFSSWIARAVS